MGARRTEPEVSALGDIDLTRPDLGSECGGVNVRDVYVPRGSAVLTASMDLARSLESFGI